MECRNKAKTEGTKHQQTHRTQEWVHSYQREREWGGWEEREGYVGKRGITIHTQIVGGVAAGVAVHWESSITQRRQVGIL